MTRMECLIIKNLKWVRFIDPKEKYFVLSFSGISELTDEDRSKLYTLLKKYKWQLPKLYKSVNP